MSWSEKACALPGYVLRCVFGYYACSCNPTENPMQRSQYSKITLKLLVEEVESNIGREVKYLEIPIGGAEKAAKLIGELLK